MKMIKSQMPPTARGASRSSDSNRRAFLWRMALLGAGASLPRALCGEDVSARPALAHDPAILSKEQWNAFAAVHDILLPSESDAPGAREINATAYLQWVISDPLLDSGDRDFLKDGLIDLDEAALQKSAVPFLKMELEDRPKLIAHVESLEWGHDWLSELLRHLFEAALSDPIYGGNQNGLGWKWLGHVPGNPRPGHKYHKLVEKFSGQAAPR